jgi:VanZ family protein
MSGPAHRAEAPARRFSWWVIVLLGWSVLLTGWTVALLRPEPVRLAKAVLPEKAEFPAAKLLHVSAYALLSGGAVLLRPLGRCRWLLLVLLSLHGMGTEYFQQFVELRGPSVRDVVIDHMGIVLGAAAVWLGNRWRVGASEKG